MALDVGSIRDGDVTMSIGLRDVGLFIAAATPVAGVIAGGIWGSLTYLHGKKLDYQKAFNEKQLEIVLLVAQTAGDLASIEREAEWRLAKERFWELYWGRLVIFEDDDVIKAMIALGNHVRNLQFEERATIQSHSYEVALALRKFLATKNDEDWRISFRVLTISKQPDKR